jgi:hypothetical protein
LKTVSIETKDETGEVLKKAIATLRAESAAGSGDSVLMQTVFDPTDLTSVKNAERSVKAALDDLRIACGTSGTKAVTCAALNALPNATAISLGVNLMAPVAAAAGGPAASDKKTADAHCGVGICYRGTLPYSVSLDALGQTRSTVVHLPNNGPLMALPLPRYAFVKTKHTVQLRNGMLESYVVDKPSSALAIAAWPLDLYDAIVKTTAKIVELKIDTSRSTVSLEEQKLAEAKRRKEIEEELEKLKSAKPESAALIGMGGIPGTILTVGLGPRPSGDRSGIPKGANPPPAVGAPTVPILPGNNGTAGQ